MKNKKSILCALLCLSSIVVGAFSFTSCGSGQTSNSDIVDPEFVMEDDSYDMAISESVLKEMLGIALNPSSAKGKIEGKLNKFALSKLTWATEGILKSIGYDIKKEKSFNEKLTEKLQNIESEIVDLKDRVDWLTSSYSDSQYLNQYNNFVTDYRKLADNIKVTYGYLKDLESNIDNGSAEKIDENLTAICNGVQGSTPVRAELDSTMMNFGYYFIGSSTNVDKLQTYSIFNIAERFVCNQTPYKENRYDQINEIISDPFTTYFAAYTLNVINYNRKLNQVGISDVYFDNSSKLVAYRVEDTGEVFVHCEPSQKNEFISKYTDTLDIDLSKAQAKTINNYNSDAYLYAGYLSEVMKQYDTISNLYTKFVDKYKVDTDTSHLTLTDGQKTEKAVKTIRCVDFMTGQGNNSIKIDYSKFGNIKRSDFINYVNTIEPYSYEAKKDGTKKALTFKEFFVKQGYQFPTNNESNLLVLGAENGFGEYDDIWNNSYGTTHHFYLISVELNKTISDFKKNPSFYKTSYGIVNWAKTQKGACSKKKNCYYVFESKGSSKSSLCRAGSDCRYADSFNSTNWTGGAPYKYYTIFGLSKNPYTLNNTNRIF